jgi:hypothetical protein
MDNPFERYDLDPRDGIAAITERLKQLAEEAKDDAERDRIRAAWEELTLHPARRLRTALFAHPETRAPLGVPPPFPRPSRGAGTAPGTATDRSPPLSVVDLCLLPSVVAVVPLADDPRDAEDEPGPSLEDDPVLRSPP